MVTHYIPQNHQFPSIRLSMIIQLWSFREASSNWNPSSLPHFGWIWMTSHKCIMYYVLLLGGTFFIFPYIGHFIIPIDSYCSEVFKPPTRLCLMYTYISHVYIPWQSVLWIHDFLIPSVFIPWHFPAISHCHVETPKSGSRISGLSWMAPSAHNSHHRRCKKNVEASAGGVTLRWPQLWHPSMGWPKMENFNRNPFRFSHVFFLDVPVFFPLNQSSESAISFHVANSWIHASLV